MNTNLLYTCFRKAYLCKAIEKRLNIDVSVLQVQACPAEESSLLDPQGRLVSVRWPESAAVPTGIHLEANMSIINLE
jgi:hypothetical protein